MNKPKKPFFVLLAILIFLIFLFLMAAALLYGVISLILWMFHVACPSEHILFYCLATPWAIFFGWRISDWVHALYLEIAIMQDGRKYW